MINGALHFRYERRVFDLWERCGTDAGAHAFFSAPMTRGKRMLSSRPAETMVAHTGSIWRRATACLCAAKDCGRPTGLGGQRFERLRRNEVLPPRVICPVCFCYEEHPRIRRETHLVCTISRVGSSPQQRSYSIYADLVSFAMREHMQFFHGDC